MLNEVGNGSYGEVFLAIHKVSKKHFAIKIVNK